MRRCGEVHDEVVDGLLHSADHRLRLTEAALGISGRMGERDIHLPCPAPALPHVVLDYRVPAAEPVPGSQTVVDPLGRVTLLLRETAVLIQDPVDHPAVRVQLRAAWQRLPAIPGRHRVLQHLAHRVPVQPEHTRRLARAHPLHHAGPAHPRVQLHFVHPLHLPSSCLQLYGRRRVVRFCSATPGRSPPPRRYIITPPFTPGFPILGVFRLNGQPKRDDGMILGSCKAIQGRYPAHQSRGS